MHRIRLTGVNAVLANRYRGHRPPYRKLLEAAQSGWIPASRDEISSIWLVDENEIPAIAAFYGLELITEPVAA